MLHLSCSRTDSLAGPGLICGAECQPLLTEIVCTDNYIKVFIIKLRLLNSIIEVLRFFIEVLCTPERGFTRGKWRRRFRCEMTFVNNVIR